MVHVVQINNKVKVLIFLLCVVVLVSTVNTTYSRYVSATDGVVTTDLARWQIFVNSNNITDNYGTSMTFIPVIEQDENVAANKIAPSSKGYFDIAIDPTNVDVSFIYDISFDVPEDSLIKDIKLTNYAIVEGTEITEDINDEDKISLNGGKSITDTLFYSNITPDFSFKPFVVRAYFAWIDDETGSMSDEEEGIVGSMAAGEDFEFSLNVNINFKQYTGIDDEALDDEGEQNPDLENPDDPEIPDNE